MSAALHTYTYITFSSNFLSNLGALGDVRNGEDIIHLFKARKEVVAESYLQRIKNPDVKRKTLNELKCDFVFRRQVIQDNQLVEVVERALKMGDYPKACAAYQAIKDPEKKAQQFKRIGDVFYL